MLPFEVIATSYWNSLLGDLKVYGWRLGGAVLVLLLTLVVARIVSSRVRAGLDRTSVGPNPTVLLARIARSTVYFLGLLWILALYSVPFTALAAVVSVAALALSLSLQDLLKNLIAGIYLLAERPFHIGDRITVSGVTGVIDDIEMRVTYLRTDLGERIIMPNQTVFTQVVVNNTVRGGRSVAVNLEVPRSVETVEIERAVNQASEALHRSAEDRPPILEPTGATPDATRWRLSIWTPDGTQASEVIRALSQELPTATIDAGTPAAS